MNIVLELDTFREDLRRADGSVLSPNVLFARAIGRRDDVAYSYHAPVFEEGPEVVRDAHEIVARRVIHDLLTHEHGAA